jgi:hypothetical protein
MVVSGHVFRRADWPTFVSEFACFWLSGKFQYRDRDKAAFANFWDRRLIRSVVASEGEALPYTTALAAPNLRLLVCIHGGDAGWLLRF